MLSLAEERHFYQYFLSQGLRVEIGMGLLFSPVLSIVSHYFISRLVGQ